MAALFYVVCFIGVFASLVENQLNTNCITPNKEIAYCVSLFSCPILQKAFSSEDPSAKTFLEDSLCPQGPLVVCCGTFENYVNNNITKEKPLVDITEVQAAGDDAYRRYVVENLLPNKAYCGKQHADDYYNTNTGTSADEFPWLVYIAQFSEQFEQKNSSMAEANCVGVLISGRYVLTDEDCYYLAKLDTVSLGRRIYNNRSCGGPHGHGHDDCISTLNVPIDAFHVKYFLKSKFILLRLKTEVIFNDHVRPICLPIDKADRTIKQGKTVVTSGWGAAEYINGNHVKTKKRISHKVLSDAECKKGKTVIDPICADKLEDNSVYVCPSDTGGPIMYKHKTNWFVGGVITMMDSCRISEPIVGQQFSEKTLNQILRAIEP